MTVIDKNFPMKPEVKEKRKNHYVDKEELNNEIIKYKETGKVSNELGLMLRSIAEHFARHPQFRGYQKMNIQEELISEGTLMCLRALKSYNPFRTDKAPNPVSYMTEVCKNAFKTYLNKHYKHENFMREQIAEYCYNNGIPFVDSVGNYLAENASEKE